MGGEELSAGHGGSQVADLESEFLDEFIPIGEGLREVVAGVDEQIPGSPARSRGACGQ